MMTSQTWEDWSCAVDVTSDDAVLPAVVDVVRAVMDEVSHAANRFDPCSDVSRINVAAGRFVGVSPLTLELVEVACTVSGTTGGCVDPMVGANLIAAGYDTDIAVVRDRARAASRPTATRATWRDIRIDRVLGRVGIPAGTALDLGATAKAWAAEEAAVRAARRTDLPVLVGIGGDLAMSGDPGDGWRVNVSEVRGSPVEELLVSEGAIATSSTVGRRFRDSEGKQRHHLIDPHTGGAAVSRWRTATVWAPSALQANALATWSLVDADAAGRAIDDKQLAARFVAHDGSVAYAGTWLPPTSEVA